MWLTRFALTVLSATLAAASDAPGAQPRMGGEMKHIFVTLSGNTIFLAIQGDPDERVWLLNYDEAYDEPADVLNGTYYSGRFGWLAQGFWSVPPGRGIFVEVIGQTSSLRVYEEFTFAPILGTDGSPTHWQWSTSMTHNWYVADGCGKFEATYRVFVGDEITGEADPAYVPSEVTLRWQVVPDRDLGDIDLDGDVDLLDFAEIQSCRTIGGGEPMLSACGCFDFDGDDDVDDADYEVFFSQVTLP